MYIHVRKYRERENYYILIYFHTPSYISCVHGTWRCYYNLAASRLHLNEICARLKKQESSTPLCKNPPWGIPTTACFFIICYLFVWLDRVKGQKQTQYVVPNITQWGKVHDTSRWLQVTRQLLVLFYIQLIKLWIRSFRYPAADFPFIIDVPKMFPRSSFIDVPPPRGTHKARLEGRKFRPSPAAPWRPTTRPS